MMALMLHSENSAVGKYRIWNPQKYLRRLGWESPTFADEYKSIPIDHGALCKGGECWECKGKGTDILVLQRPDRPEVVALAQALREQYNCPIVYESDDDIYDVSKRSTSYKYWYKGSPLIELAEYIMKESDAITVSTVALAEKYKHLNSNIYVLPNFQDVEDWSFPYHTQSHGSKLIIGWQGSSTHYDDLNLIKRPLFQVLEHHPEVEFHVWGMDTDYLHGQKQVKIENKQWVHARAWPAKFASLGFDISIAPVVDRAFNRGKSNIKWQEASMLGIPTIASNVGEYKQIEHGKTGFLAKTRKDWQTYLELLIQDAKLRKQIGEQAKQKVTQDCTLNSRIDLWDQTYRAIIDRYKTSGQHTDSIQPRNDI